jgi:hypothetical protein
MKEIKYKNNGALFGVRYLDFFFFPKFRFLEEGLEISGTGEVILWHQIKEIRQFDNMFWRLMRRPLSPGAYVRLNNDKEFWISARLIRKDRSFKDIISNWFAHQTEDYLWLLSEIRQRSQIMQAESQLETVLDRTTITYRSGAMVVIAILIIWTLLRLIGR